MRAASLSLLASLAVADKPGDLITSLPGFPDASSWGFKAYSGFIEVPGPVTGYDGLRIHYQFHLSQRDPSSDPVTIWHQGGPGGSSINTGLYGEMGAFRIGDKAHGDYINPWAWNRVANMLYLESPAGSGYITGDSECLRGGKPVPCTWNDTSQAEAYAHTLQAFFVAFPEFAKNDFYLTGESYFGQYGPNIAHFILNNEPFKSKINLKGLAAGNACWGGTESCVACNGPSQDRLDVDLYFGKGLFSPKLKKQIDETCNFPTEYHLPSGGGGKGPFDCDGESSLSSECKALLTQMNKEVGPHNTYNIYDNCPGILSLLERTGKDMAWLRRTLRNSMHNATATWDALKTANGGYDWDCNGLAEVWMLRPGVRKALHLDPLPRAGSSFSYACSGPASITLYPELAQKIRILIFNGDADACVPYNGNEDWVLGLEAKGILEETSAWTPWFTSNKRTPAGYATQYQAPKSAVDFTFQTIRLAGHMVPQFQPEAAFVMIADFLAGPKHKSQQVV